MRTTNLASASALCPALIYAPTVTVVLTVVLLASAAALLGWFAKQTPAVRRDLVQLVRALRGN